MTKSIEINSIDIEKKIDNNISPFYNYINDNYIGKIDLKTNFSHIKNQNDTYKNKNSSELIIQKFYFLFLNIKEKINDEIKQSVYKNYILKNNKMDKNNYNTYLNISGLNYENSTLYSFLHRNLNVNQKEIYNCNLSKKKFEFVNYNDNIYFFSNEEIIMKKIDKDDKISIKTKDLIDKKIFRLIENNYTKNSFSFSLESSYINIIDSSIIRSNTEKSIETNNFTREFSRSKFCYCSNKKYHRCENNFEDICSYCCENYPYDNFSHVENEDLSISGEDSRVNSRKNSLINTKFENYLKILKAEKDSYKNMNNSLNSFKLDKKIENKKESKNLDIISCDYNFKNEVKNFKKSFKNGTYHIFKNFIPLNMFEEDKSEIDNLGLKINDCSENGSDSQITHTLLPTYLRNDEKYKKKLTNFLNMPMQKKIKTEKLKFGLKRKFYQIDKINFNGNVTKFYNKLGINLKKCFSLRKHFEALYFLENDNGKMQSFKIFKDEEIGLSKEWQRQLKITVYFSYNFYNFSKY